MFVGNCYDIVVQMVPTFVCVVYVTFYTLTYNSPHSSYSRIDMFYEHWIYKKPVLWKTFEWKISNGDLKCNLMPSQSSDQLHLAFREETSSKSSVYSWFSEFLREHITSETNFVKVVRPRLLLHLMLMLCVKWLCKIGISHTVRFEHIWVLTWKLCIQCLYDYLDARKLSSCWILYNLKNLTQNKVSQKWSKHSTKVIQI